MRAHTPLTACLLLATVLPVTPAYAQRRAASPKPNILFITIDTLRADRVGCFGAKSPPTPAIDSLCRDGVAFERAIAQVPLTLPSHAAMLTGTYPFHNGVQDFTGQPLAPSFRSIAESFREHGYATAAVVSAFVLDRSWGLARGFDHYDDAIIASEALAHSHLGSLERPAEQSVTRALEWLEKPRQKPFFLWLHLFDPHSPYAPPQPYKSRYAERPYDGEVANVDAQLARVLAWLKAQKLYEQTAIVLVSDHGESLGDHGEKEHGFFIYNSTVHVPLVVKAPARSRIRPQRVPDLVETISIPATLLQLAGIEDKIQAQLQAGSLLPKERQPKPAYSETFYPFSSFGWAPLRGLQTHEYQFIDAPAPELYQLDSDPQQQRNLAAERPAVTSVLKSELAQRTRAHAPAAAQSAGNLDPETIDRLRALGYVAHRSPVTPEALAKGLANPRDKLWEFNAILEATDALSAGQLEQAEALLNQLKEKEPGLYLVHFLLADAASRREDWPAAAAHYQQTLELSPQFDQAMTGLSRALFRSGKQADAVSWVRKALDLNPQNFRAWYQLGWIQSQASPQEAAAAFEKALSVQPNFAFAHRDLGMLHFHRQDYAGAARSLQSAADLGVTDPPLLNFLGISYSRLGRLDEAVRNYRAALAGDPSLAEAHLNLGFALQRLERPAEARAAYEAACRLQAQFCRYVPR